MKLIKSLLLILLSTYSSYNFAEAIPLAKKLGGGEAEMLELNKDIKNKYTYKKYELIVSHGYSGYQWNGCDISDATTSKFDQTLWESEKSNGRVEVVSCELNLGFYKFCSASTRDNNGLFYSINPPGVYGKEGWVVRAWIYPTKTPQIAQAVSINCVL
jgi:hypothetical protein